ncbi:unnamed protein product [Symbiodinium sp. CCMP2592]|nr:unnamed protein product [Symbiodinium sp. CCMP2592]
MGRGKHQWPEWKDSDDYGGHWSSSSWSKWSWGKDGGKGKQAGKGKDKPTPRSARDEPNFPTFDAMPVTGVERRDPECRTTRTKDTKNTTVDLVQGTQRLVNQLRRAEAKVRRNEEDREHIAEQWKLFQAKLKKTFVKERNKYLDLVRKNKAEQEENLTSQENALIALQDVLNGGVVTAAVPKEEPTPEDEAEWAKLISEEDADDDMGLAGFLHGTLDGQVELRKAARQKMLQAIAVKREALRRDKEPFTPPSRGTKAAALSPPASRPAVRRGDHGLEATTGTAAGSYTGEDNVLKDPYQISPSNMRAPTPGARQRSRSHTNGPRLGIKTHLKGPVKTLKPGTLAKKLAAKRAAAMAAGSEQVIDLETELGAEDDENDMVADLRTHPEDPGKDGSGFFGLSTAVPYEYLGGGPWPAHDSDRAVLSAHDFENLKRSRDDTADVYIGAKTTARHGPKGGHDRGGTTIAGYRQGCPELSVGSPERAVLQLLTCSGNGDSGHSDAECLWDPQGHRGLLDRSGTTVAGYLQGYPEVRPRLMEVPDKQAWTRSRYRYYDIMDWIDYVEDTVDDYFRKHVETMRTVANGIGMTLLLVSFLSLTMLLCPKGGRRTKRQCFTGPALAWAACTMIQGATAVPDNARPRMRTGVPRPTDLETWAAGLLTPREQLAQAEAMWAIARSLEHGTGQARMPTYEVRAEDPIFDFTEVDVANVHVTCWVATPFYEPEIIDLEVRFPTTVDRLQTAVSDSTRHIPEYAEEIIPTVPQVDNHFASFVAMPKWVRESDRVVQVVDATNIGGGVFAAYLDRPVTRQQVLTTVVEGWPEGMGVYAYGSDRPWRNNVVYNPVQGGLLKIMRRGNQPRWADDLQVRTGDPRRWNPQVPLPSPVAGLHTVYQSADDQVLEEIASDDERPLEIAGGGRRVWGQIAVLDGVEQHGPNEPVIFTDLRGLGLFPQWTQLEGNIFRPLDYYDTLGMPDLEGWAVMVQGGDPQDDDTTIVVQPGEVLAFHLAKDEVVRGEGRGEEDDDSSSDSEEDDSSEGEDALPDSSDLEPPDADVIGGPPRGPPPPQPVNRPRSRTPRRRNDARMSCGKDIELAAHLPPPEFDIGMQQLQLPTEASCLDKLRRPWDPGWMKPLPCEPIYKLETVEAIAGMKHWSDLLADEYDLRTAEIHLYSDGSWMEERQLGGYAVAVVLVCAGTQAIMGAWGERTQGGTDPTWWADSPPALHNEQIALATGLLWILQSRAFLGASGYFLHYDCQVAGKAVSGVWNYVNEMGERSRLLEMYLQELIHVPIATMHVKAHQGDPFNELVDVLSKEAAKGSIQLPAPPRDTCAAFREIDMTWMAASCHARRWSTLPITPQGNLFWSYLRKEEKSHLQPEQLIPTQPGPGTDDRLGAGFALKAVTLNAQSLKGKHKFYEAQMIEQQCHLAFLQETKGKAGVCESKDFLRLSTDGLSHWGVDIWINKRLGLCTYQGRPLVVTEDDVQVIYESPRLLTLSVDIGGRTIVLVSGHAPHSARIEEAKVFFEDLQQSIKLLAKASLIVMGLDLNGRIPLEVPGITGSRRCGEPDGIGGMMLSVARSCHLWFPSTYDELHQGPDATYHQPAGEDKMGHRIDYLVLGGVAVLTEVASQVLDSFDTLAPSVDHEAVMVDFSGVLDGPPQRSQVWKPKYDVEKILTDAGRKAVEEAMWDYVPPRWEVHPTDHYEHFRQHVHCILRDNFALNAEDKRADYISDRVWAIRTTKLDLKRRARHRRGLWQDLADRAFLQWATGVDHAVCLLIEKHLLLYELVAAAIQFATSRLKQGIRQDKAHYLRNLAVTNGTAFKDVATVAKKAGLGGRAARTPWRPMPTLKDSTGAAAATRQAKDAVWMEHFGRQECGHIIPTTELIRGDSTTIAIDGDWEWKLSDVPTILELENALRRAPRRKAVGLDGIPGEFLLANPPATARALYALTAKAALRMCQPLHWRGGVLQECWKRSGSKENVDSYRSLYISSLPAKCVHRMLRDRAGQCIEEGLHSFQLGARKQAPVLLPALYIQAFLRWTKRVNHSVAILFVDFQSAYYKVVRELAVGDIEPESDEAVAKIFKTFGLPPEDVANLYQTIRSGGMLADAGLPPALRHQAKDMLHRSWFITRHGGSEQVNVTSAGSRPGSSWADIIYAFVLGRLLTILREHAAAEDLLTTLSVDLEGGPMGDPQDGVPIEARGSVWADDCSLPLSDPDPLRLLSKARRACELLIEFSLAHGMSPNLKPKKTAIILALRGKGAHQARKAEFADGRNVLRLPELGLEVQVAPSYVHLGGLVEPEVKMVAEARRRLGMAKTAFDAGRNLLYCNTTIPIETRSALFRMSITATCFNLALWIPSGRAWEILDGGFTRILKGLLAKTYKGEEYHKLAAPMVHILTQTPDLALLARRARLSLLISLCRTAPPVLWAVLQSERSWTDTVIADMEWLRTDSEVWPATDPQHWPEWHNILTRSTAWVKRRIAKKAADEYDKFCEVQRTNLALWGLYRQACRAFPQKACATMPWVCRMCAKSMKTKAALGAHFFKVHGRKAAYRQHGGGTICRSCNRDYRSRTKLMVHLRDTPKCVAVLATMEPNATPFIPGLGSRGWREAAEKDYTPALPARVSEALPPAGETKWPPAVRRAYADVCEHLLVKEDGVSIAVYRDRVLRVLDGYPLYFEEALEILETVEADLVTICDNDLNEYWTTSGLSNLRESLKEITPDLWSGGIVEHDDHLPQESLRSFAARLASLDWKDILPPKCYETHDDSSVLLDDDWEVAWRRSSELPKRATVVDYWRLVPGPLQVAWDELLKGPGNFEGTATAASRRMQHRLDVLRPVPVEHAGPSRLRAVSPHRFLTKEARGLLYIRKVGATNRAEECALLVKLARDGLSPHGIAAVKPQTIDHDTGERREWQLAGTAGNKLLAECLFHEPHMCDCTGKKSLVEVLKLLAESKKLREQALAATSVKPKQSVHVSLACMGPVLKVARKSPNVDALAQVTKRLARDAMQT